MTSLTLAELTPENLPAAVGLRVAPGQEVFVASVLESVAEAYVNPSAWPRAVVRDGTVVGFVMASFDPDHDVEEFRAGIWRLLVDASAQGTGVGRYAVEQVVAEARRRGTSRITVLWERGEGGPEGFYLRLGFVPTGVELFGQTVGALDV